jgi:hypothetical protein
MQHQIPTETQSCHPPSRRSAYSRDLRTRLRTGDIEKKSDGIPGSARHIHDFMSFVYLSKQEDQIRSPFAMRDPIQSVLDAIP